MKIGIDCRSLNKITNEEPGGNTGHSVCIYNHIKHLPVIDKENEYTDQRQSFLPSGDS